MLTADVKENSASSVLEGSTIDELEGVSTIDSVVDALALVLEGITVDGLAGVSATDFEVDVSVSAVPDGNIVVEAGVSKVRTA